jgi:hypothetical protein
MWFWPGRDSNRSSRSMSEDRGGHPRVVEVRDPAVDACLAEYHALRGEMLWLREEAAQYQGFALAITAALGPLLGFELASHTKWVIPTMVVVPLPFAVLGFLFFRQHLEVYIVAEYIRKHIRDKIRTLCSAQRHGPPRTDAEMAAIKDLWNWEEVKSEEFRDFVKIRWLDFIVAHKLAVFMRTALFLGPAVAAMVTAVALVLQSNMRSLYTEYSKAGCWLMLVCFVADIVSVALLVALLAARGDFSRSVLRTEAVLLLAD